jgi:hypothetical protein
LRNDDNYARKILARLIWEKNGADSAGLRRILGGAHRRSGEGSYKSVPGKI